MEFHPPNTTVREMRNQLRRKLDDMPDFIVQDSGLDFRQTFETLESPETYFMTPAEIINAARGIMTGERNDSIARVVRDTLFFRVGCNVVPIFALATGGLGRTLFEFRCVFDGCSAFLDVRFFPAVDIIKWVILGVSHSHTFSVFPPRMPRSTFPRDVMETIREMAARKVRTPEIKMAVGALCNGDVFQNALRPVRATLGADQCRDLRNAASSSTLWTSSINLTRENVFVEAFFTNSALVSKSFVVDFVYLDDTSCVNVFSLPIVCVLCRDASSQTHTVAWGVIQNRTTETFKRFFQFVKNSFPSIQTFMCDRHFGQRRAIREVFGSGVSVFHCCVHIARNIRTNCGPNTTLHRAFWEMRFKRTQEAEASFIQTLERINASRKTTFTTELLNSLNSFVPSAVDPILKKPTFPSLLALRGIDTSSFITDTPRKRRVVALVRCLQQAECPDADVFALDNTNAIEGYFNGIKRRMQVSPLTLLDIFRAVDSTDPACFPHEASSPAIARKPFKATKRQRPPPSSLRRLEESNKG